MDPYATRLVCPWYSPEKNIKVVCHILLQSVFPTQGSNPCLLHWRADSLPLSHLGSPTADLVQRCPGIPKTVPHNLSEMIEQVALTLSFIQSFWVPQAIKNSPAMQETWVWPSGQENPLKKEMTTHTPVSFPGEFHDRGAWLATVHGVTDYANMNEWTSTQT